MRTLIVGTGRSATRYCTEVLRACGLTVGHQTWRHEHTLGRPFVWEGDAVVSFEAVPAITRLRMEYRDLRVVHVVRDEDATVASWLRLGAFGDDHRDQYLLWGIVLDKYWGDRWFRGIPEERARFYVREWNRWAADQGPDATVRLTRTNVDAEWLIRAVGLLPDLDKLIAAVAVPTDTNHVLIDD